RAALSGFLLAQGHRWLRGVKVVVSDGSGSYRSAIAQHLGHATHVLDRFHVARWFAAGMIEVRRRIQRIAPKDHARHSNRPSSGPGICSSPASTTCLTTASKPWGGSWPTGPNWKRPGGCSSTSTASTSPKTQTRPTRRLGRSSTFGTTHPWWSSTGSSKRCSSGETRSSPSTTQTASPTAASKAPTTASVSSNESPTGSSTCRTSPPEHSSSPPAWQHHHDRESKGPPTSTRRTSFHNTNQPALDSTRCSHGVEDVCGPPVAAQLDGHVATIGTEQGDGRLVVLRLGAPNRTHPGEVTRSRRDLVEAHSAVVGERNAYPGHDLVVRRRRRVGALYELACRYLSTTGRGLEVHARSEGRTARDQFCRGIPVGETAADRPALAYRLVADVARRLHQQRGMSEDRGVSTQGGVRDESPEVQGSIDDP